MKDLRPDCKGVTLYEINAIFSNVSLIVGINKTMLANHLCRPTVVLK